MEHPTQPLLIALRIHFCHFLFEFKKCVRSSMSLTVGGLVDVTLSDEDLKRIGVALSQLIGESSRLIFLDPPSEITKSVEGERV
jgi:hypothetical protein